MKYRLIAGLWFATAALIALLLIMPLMHGITHYFHSVTWMFTLLPVIGSFVFGAWFGKRLFDTPTKEEIFKVGLSIPTAITVVCAVVFNIYYLLELNSYRGPIPVAIYAPISIVSNIILALLVTGFITLPIGVLAAYGLVKLVAKRAISGLSSK